MSDYEYDNPDVAYQEALRCIKQAKGNFLRQKATELDLTGLGLTAVPPEIGQLTWLKKLRLGRNQLTTVPPEIGQLTWLELLGLEENQLTTLPPEIGQLTRLKQLVLRGNQLTAVPPKIWQLTGLETIDLSGNQLTTVPPEIGQLTRLKELKLHENRLTTIPPEIGRLIGLRDLWLRENQLTAVPPEIGQLTELEALEIGDNEFAIIPPEIFQLSLLNIFSIYKNKLTYIPPEIGQLTALNQLFLWENKLKTISPEITQLTKLKTLILDGNPDLPIPPEIVAQGKNAQAILDYLRQQQAETARPLNEAKLILVGQGGVGKTSLVRRLIGRGFNAAENQTEGINIENWSLDVNRPAQGIVPVALNIWDFGGQEIMHATHQFFLTKRSLYLLVLDARQGEDEGRVEYWLALINSFAPNAPILIVINKSDQHHLDINRRGLQEKYPAIQGFIRTSARDNDGIGTLKTEIAAILAEMDHVDSAFPASWMQVKQALVAMQKEKRHFLPYEEYEQLCRHNGVADESSQTTLVRFLHDLGIVLNFTDDDRVRDTSVLNPNWVTTGIYTLLNHKALQQEYGLLPRNQVRRLLPDADYPSQQRRFLLDMMLKFELAFALPDGKTLLVPDLISKEQPAFEWNDADALHFAYQYRVLPRSILHRFMVRQHQRIDPDIRWRTGVMLYADGFRALVKADIKAATIRIAILGDGDRRQFLYSLRLEFAGIHETIQGTQPQEVVPIPGHSEAEPIGYAYLEQLEKQNIPILPYPGKNGALIMLDVQKLLNGVSTSAMRQIGLPHRSNILTELRSGFNDSEFYGLLSELDVNRNDIGGETITDQMRECVAYMDRRNRIPELVAAIRRERPYMDL